MTALSEPTLEGRFVVVPAAYVYLLRDGATGPEVLLQLRQGTGFMDGHWAAAAAGHVERGETAYDAARREAREEVDVEDVELEFVTAMQRTRGGEPIDERIDFFFTARSWRGEPRIVEPEKCADMRWCPLGDLPHPVVPHELAVLRDIRSGTSTPYCTFGFEGDHWMSEETRTDTGSGELAPMPEPQIEPGEPNPGGADAIDDSGDRIIPDLTPEENPAIDDKTPADLQEQMSGAEDTSTEATEASAEDAGGQDQGSAEQGKAE